MKNMFLGLAATLLMVSSAFAANLDNPIRGIYQGSVSNTLTIHVDATVSKSPETFTQGALTFDLAPQTIYNGFNQLSDLSIGDTVDVEYKVTDRDKKMVAASVTLVPPATTTTVTTTTTQTTETAPAY